MKDLNRIKHAIRRFPEARRRFYRRLIYRRFSSQLGRKVSLTYGVETTTSSLVAPSVYLRLKSSNGYLESLEHHFPSRYLLEEREPSLNVETGAIYRRNLQGPPHYIVESSEWSDELKLLYDESKIKKATHIEGKFARGITQTGFYHIITEELPQILYLSQFKPVFLQGWRGHSLAQEVFATLGVKSLELNGFIKPSQLIFVTRGKDIGYLHPFSLHLLREFRDRVLNDHSNKGPEKIYISRQNSRRSHPLEFEIQRSYLDKGFHIFESQGMSLVEQINFFANCREIVGLHGAGITNAIWSENCKVLELMPRNRVNRCFEWQSFLCNQEYEVKMLPS